MKNFNDFMKEEASIVGNAGVPDENNSGRKGDYLKNLEADAKRKHGLSGDARRDEREIGPLINRFMQLMGSSNRNKNLIFSKKVELENLAKEIILSEYGDILEGVELDIKLSTPKEVQANLDDSEESDQPTFKDITDKKVIMAIQKAKLANEIIQGEAINTKRIISMPEIKEKVIEILGTRGEEIYNNWQEIGDIMQKLNWIIPIEHRLNMVQEDESAGGSVKVDWKPKEYKESDETGDKQEEEPKEENEEEESEEIFDDYTPVIRARGVDFPMLIHEAVKGVYELIAAVGIPTDEKLAELVKMNTSGKFDELEDFMYGPEIAGELRDFINTCKDNDHHQNMREFVFGDMMKMEPELFLKLFKGILSKTPEAKAEVEKIIQSVIKRLKDYDDESTEFDAKQKLGEFDNEEERGYSEKDIESSPEWYKEEESDLDKIKNKSNERELKDLSPSEIQKLIDDALDKEDYDEVKKLSGYLPKEGRGIYLKEIERINESHTQHTRRNKI